MSTHPDTSNQKPEEERSTEYQQPENEAKSYASKSLTPGRQKLRSWLNKTFRIKLSDGRILVGYFLCTDRDANIILGMSSEYRDEEERTLGLVIVPKKHIVSIEVADNKDDII